MVSALADRHRWHIHVEAFQQLSQHLALGLDESLMELTFHALEDFIAKRPGSKSIDVLAQPCERTRCSWWSLADMDGT